MGEGPLNTSPVGAAPTDTETAILDAALAEVLAHGIRRTSVSDIARRSGISRQTIYRYWSDAQALFAELVTRELLAVVPVSGPPPDLDTLVDELVATADNVRRLPLVERVRDTDPELFARYILERLGTSQRAIHGLLVLRIRAGQAVGYVRPGDPAALAAMILLVTQSAVQSAPLVEEWLAGEAWRDELAHVVRSYLRKDPA